MNPVITAVSRSAKHTLIKPNEDSIRLLTGLGVEFARQYANDGHRVIATCLDHALAQLLLVGLDRVQLLLDPVLLFKDAANLFLRLL